MSEEEEDTEWMQAADAVDHVSAIERCYRPLADDLLRKAVQELKVKSRTASPGWIEEGDNYYLDQGKSIEVLRADLMRLWPESKDDQKKNVAKASPISESIYAAIMALWSGKIPGTLLAKDRDALIRTWLDENGLPNATEDSTLSKAIQRVMAKMRQNQGMVRKI